ncbi:MAG: hypothetical protein WAL75_11335 [Terracidiphilus sp.]
MPNFSSGKSLSIIVLGAVAFLFAGCHSNQQTSSTDNGANPATGSDQTQQATQDETSANLVPVANTSGAADTSSGAPSAASGSSAAGGDYGSTTAAPADDSADESTYGVEPAATAPQPPPELPQYDQPPCPEDGDIWTPGHWGYESTGYYWVPGAWVQAPYQGALWTPGYWGWSHNRYSYFRGYWGPHIGFYGGVNYGFGYVGLGYQGGYWNSGHFFYNRTVSNVNVTVIHNVYNRTVINNTVINRVSFNGGRGGIQVRPRLAELAALREPHAPPMRTQIEIEHTASQNRAQFESVNHGRPATFVETRVVVADHDVHPAVWHNLHNVPEAARPVNESRREPEPATHAEPNRPEPRPEANRPEPNRPEAKPEQKRPEPSRAEPQRHPEAAHAAPAHREAPPAERRPAQEKKPAPKKPTPEHRSSEPQP